jgi:hypothetical protein
MAKPAPRPHRQPRPMLSDHALWDGFLSVFWYIGALFCLAPFWHPHWRAQ